MTPNDKWHVDNLHAAIARLESAKAALEATPDDAGPAAALAAAILATVDYDIAENDAALAVLHLVNHIAGVPSETAFRTRRALREEILLERPWRLHCSWLRVLEGGMVDDLLQEIEEVA